jgi:pyruvate/2-oxoglutarate dehydrogenase complex dihydrolipoamide dehydrogenase (E3) component
VALERSLSKQGIKILTNTKVASAKVEKGQVRLNLEGKTAQALEADCALAAIGVSPIVPSGLSIALDKKGSFRWTIGIRPMSRAYSLPVMSSGHPGWLM